LRPLREKWPAAFPVKLHNVRPLAVGAPGEIAAAMGWSLAYTRGVLIPWKMSPAYCRAVLSHDQRIALDGSPAGSPSACSSPSISSTSELYCARAAARIVERHHR
jgi:ProQ/FINO family